MAIPSIADDPGIGDLTKRLTRLTGVVHASGLWGSSAPMLTALTACSAPRLVVYVTAHVERADATREDLELFLGRTCEIFPAWETIAGEGAASGEIEAERLRVCTFLGRLRAGESAREPSVVVVAPIQALMQPVPSPAVLDRNTLHMARGGNDGNLAARSPEALVAWAIDRGFGRLDLVETPGDVARRGDIVDLFAPGEVTPFRIQFFDDEVESIRRFDVGTQRSIETLTAVSLAALPQEPVARGTDTTDLVTYLPADTLIVLDEASDIQTMGETIHRRIGPSEFLFEVANVLGRLCAFPQLHLSAFPPAATGDEDRYEFPVRSLSRFEGDASAAVDELCTIGRDHEVHIVCDTAGERDRLLDMIAEASNRASEPPPSVHTHLGILHRGFDWSSRGTLVVSHHEIFHRHRQRRRVRRTHAGQPLETWTDLRPGDVVVHAVHGIGVYRGLKMMQRGEARANEEYLTLEFAEQSRVYVPCSQVDLVQKYIGAGGRRPELSKIGGKRWVTAKAQAADAVAELAESLLRVQATREAAVGLAFPPDTQWQGEFEAAFPYQETEDQLLVAGEIRDDLQRVRPMDRLVCGDVGYGKTELAMRAAFKVVEYGRQVALLVPTTVLAEQHYLTFRERMAEYPFSIACLSRFRTGAEQARIIDQLKKGQIDIVIGTHRLVSKDVSFADLGLAIIDEEQRFGVEHKERLRAMRETVDILTLTATPIPRTLHMSLMGLRDISSLQTPPIDRRSIATQVVAFNRDLIRSAVLRELNRDGQVYFIHNFVNSIAAMADQIRQIVPEARIVHAHGRMAAHELEHIMRKFLRREADILVATTIIESGIDIPTVNTIFINRAERFGLADLHQLRGRVGRSDHRAYCYLLLSPDRPPTRKAADRLKTIEEFSELGAGFRIAMRDLEIRGTGNLLGREQSGHIASVGYEMYCSLLNQAVRRLRDEPDPIPPPVQLDLNVGATLPQRYIAHDRARLEVHRRIVSCHTEGDLRRLEEDLTDAFGPHPKEVRGLLDLAEIRVHARRFGLVSISLRPPDVIFSIENLPLAEPLFAEAAGTVRLPDDTTVYWRPPSSYLEPLTLVTVLRKMFDGALSRSEPAK